jgi:hypothetical protein
MTTDPGEVASAMEAGYAAELGRQSAGLAAPNALPPAAPEPERIRPVYVTTVPPATSAEVDTAEAETG